MNVPDDIKKVLKENPGLAAVAVGEASCDMPELYRFEKMLMRVRDDLARNIDVDPENMKLVGIQAVYSVESIEGGNIVGLVIRNRVEPGYEEYINLL